MQNMFCALETRLLRPYPLAELPVPTSWGSSWAFVKCPGCRADFVGSKLMDEGAS